MGSPSLVCRLSFVFFLVWQASSSRVGEDHGDENGGEFEGTITDHFAGEDVEASQGGHLPPPNPFAEVALLAPSDVNITAREMPWVSTDWAAKNGYEVSLQGALRIEGSNGAIALWNFQKSGMVQPGRWYQGVVVHKGTLLNKDGALTEPLFTESASAINGLSVTAVGSGIAWGRMHMLVEYIRGNDLDELMEFAHFRYHNRADKAVRFLMAQIFYHLWQLQEQDVVHRDIKMENLVFPEACNALWTDPAAYSLMDWVKYDCRLTLIDYGLACTRTPSCPGGVLLDEGDCQCPIAMSVNDSEGTLENNPPEAWGPLPKSSEGWKPMFDKAIGRWHHRSDVFTAGVVLYAIFVEPFPTYFLPSGSSGRPDPAAVLSVVADGELGDKLRAKMDARGIPADLQDILVKMMHPNFNKRPSGRKLWGSDVIAHERQYVERLALRALHKRHWAGVLPPLPVEFVDEA